MKSVDEIRKLTDKAKKEKEEQKRLAELEAKKKAEKEHEAKKKAEKEHEEMVARAKDVSFFFKQIEEAAKNGENTYSISLGRNDDSEYDKLHMQYIKEYLKDFNPTFTEEREQGCDYDWEGGVIDGSEYYYTATHVHFNW